MALNMDVVRHLTASPDLPPARLTGYDYILAGNGLFKRALSRHVEVMLPLANVCVAGLSECTSYLHLHAGKLPGSFLHSLLKDARQVSRAAAQEAMYHIVRGTDGRAKLLKPSQQATGGRVMYAGGGDASVICDLHSHHTMGAYFSGTDSADEQGFRFYATVGQIFTRPEIALRIGIYGDFWPVPVADLFSDTVPFEDAK